MVLVRNRAAFTLIELLVVMGIIAAIAGMSFGVYYALIGDSKEDQTRMLVDAVVVAVENYGVKSATIMGGMQMVWMWDIDVDPADTESYGNIKTAAREHDKFVMDGDPRAPGAPDRLTLNAPPWYRGAGYMLKMPAQNVDEQGRIVDAWDQPLHIVWNDEVFPANGYGVWSIGEDAVPDPFNPDGDDICSWRK